MKSIMNSLTHSLLTHSLPYSISLSLNDPLSFLARGGGSVMEVKSQVVSNLDRERWNVGSVDAYV